MWLIILSGINFINLVFNNLLHLEKGRIDSLYSIDKAGNYQVFRETVSQKQFNNPKVVFIVGFRLKIIGSNSLLHWLFQRLCILTTPFWSGFKGFHIKLWLVNPENKNYLGIYEWFGRENSQIYLNMLIPILNVVSTSGSVWFKIYPKEDLDHFLKSKIKL